MAFANVKDYSQSGFEPMTLQIAQKVVCLQTLPEFKLCLTLLNIITCRPETEISINDFKQGLLLKRYKA